MEKPIESKESVVISTFEKNKKEEVRVSVDLFHGRRFINLRVYYRDDDGEMKPGRQGISVALDNYKNLAGAILEVGQYLQSEKLI